MRRAALAFIFLLAAASPALAQNGVPASRVIAVWGEGEAHAKPDMAQLSAGVVSEGDSAGAALSANSAAMAKVIAAVKGLGITARDIQTQSVSVNPVYGRAQPGGSQHIDGYRASNTVQVRLHDLDKVGRLLDAVTEAGANVAHGLTLEVAETDTLADRARETAMSDAHRKADALAKAAGVTLGQVVSISEEGAGGRPVPMVRTMAMEAKSAPIEPGESTVTARLRVVYAIE